ncbi:flagellar hook-basal body complex protein FliE [Clostridium akagii]|uniref:flagellar hook-basal body complex protein FliE n=1 Tax=Clostridium akagii TaxID=91623 RepID=UPI003BF9AE1E
MLSNSSNVSSANASNDQATSGTGSVDFSSILKEKLGAVNDKQISADNTTTQFIDGKDVDIHQVMLSTSEAQMSLDMAVQVRNKIVEAYQELNKTQV